MTTTYEALWKERQLMDDAIARGSIKVSLKSVGALINFRQRCYQARKLDRERSMQVYKPGEENFGKSRYDSLAFTKVDKLTLLIEHQPGDLPVGVTEVS